MTYSLPTFRFQDGYGVWWQYQIKQPATDYSLGRCGNAFRFEVREGDHPSFDDHRDGTADANERAEIYQINDGSTFVPKGLDYGVEHWFSGSLRIVTETPNVASYCILTQIAAQPDSGEPAASPVFSVLLNADNNLVVETRTSADNPRTGNPTANDHHVGAIQRAVANRFMWQLVLDHRLNGDGALNLWLNEAQIVQYRGPIGYDDVAEPYWKAGIYRATSATPFVVEWANLRRGRSAADVGGFVSTPRAATRRRRSGFSDYGQCRPGRTQNYKPSL